MAQLLLAMHCYCIMEAHVLMCVFVDHTVKWALEKCENISCINKHSFAVCKGFAGQLDA